MPVLNKTTSSSSSTPSTRGLSVNPRLMGLVAASMLSGLAGACTGILPFSQCNQDADCADDGVCQDNICVAGETGDENASSETGDGDGDGDSSGDGDGDSAGDGDGDSSGDGDGDGDSSGDGDGDGDGACTSTSECQAAMGADFVCGTAGTCVNLLSTECQRVRWPGNADPGDLDAAALDSVVWVASLMPTSPPFDVLVQPLENSVQLAADDWNNTVELQGDRTIGMIFCDVTGGSAVAEIAAAHVIDEIGIPAMIGPIFSQTTIDVAENVAIPADVFVISPTGTSKEITTLDDNDLVWRTIPSDIYQANAMADRTAEWMPAPANVLVLYKDDAYGNGLLTDMFSKLDSQFGSSNFVSIKYPDPASFTNPDDLQAAYGQVIANALGAFGGPLPESVILLGTSETKDLVQGYVGGLATVPTLTVPRFFVSHGGVPSMELIVDTIESLNPGLAAYKTPLINAVEGNAPVIQDPDNFAAYNIRYRIAFNNQDAITASSLSYDASLVTFFAMSTIAAEDPITGPSIAAAMGDLQDAGGTAVSFSGTGLDFIETGRNALATGGTVDLQGTSGALTFDLMTGEVRVDHIGWDLFDQGLLTGGSANEDAFLVPTRIYSLNPDPAADGTWSDLPTP